MAGFLSGVSDAFDAITQNLLPYYTATIEGSTNKADTRAAAEVAKANANATSITAQAKAKTYAAMAIAAVAAVAVLILIKKRRG